MGDCPLGPVLELNFIDVVVKVVGTLGGAKETE